MVRGVCPEKSSMKYHRLNRGFPFSLLRAGTNIRCGSEEWNEGLELIYLNMESNFQLHISSLSSTLLTEGRIHEPPHPPIRLGIVGYYAPYVLAGVLCVLYAVTAAAPERWWLAVLLQIVAVGGVYYTTLRREDTLKMIIPALVVSILGLLHFMTVNGTVFRLFNAVVVSFAIAAHLRGVLRAYSFSHQLLSTYRISLAFFLASLSVYMVMAVVAAMVMLLQFPWWGAGGVIFLVVFTMTNHTMSFTLQPRPLQICAPWILTAVSVELAIIFLFIPSLPFVAAALLLSFYAPLSELSLTGATFPSSRAFLLRGGGVVAAWALVLGTARWP